MNVGGRVGRVAAGLQIAGCVSLTFAAGLLHLAAGFAAAGVALLLFGLSLERG